MDDYTEIKKHDRIYRPKKNLSTWFGEFGPALLTGPAPALPHYVLYIILLPVLYFSLLFLFLSQQR